MVPSNSLAPDERRARLRILIRERNGRQIKEVMLAKLADRRVDLSGWTWYELKAADDLRERYSSARAEHRKQQTEWVRLFGDIDELVEYVNGLELGSGGSSACALFSEPDLGALKGDAVAVMHHSVDLAEADENWIGVSNCQFTQGYMIDRIVHDDESVAYEITVWGKRS